MPDETTTINEVKTTSDGSVKISVEKYEELLSKAAAKPPVINRTTVIKTAEIAAKEYRLWGGTLMGMGVALFAAGAVLYNAGRVG
jgi:hypothetical protein